MKFPVIGVSAEIVTYAPEIYRSVNMGRMPYQCLRYPLLLIITCFNSTKNPLRYNVAGLEPLCTCSRGCTCVQIVCRKTVSSFNMADMQFFEFNTGRHMIYSDNEPVFDTFRGISLNIDFQERVKIMLIQQPQKVPANSTIIELFLILKKI